MTNCHVTAGGAAARSAMTWGIWTRYYNIMHYGAKCYGTLWCAVFAQNNAEHIQNTQNHQCIFANIVQ